MARKTMNESPDPLALTAEQAAALIGISRTHFYRLRSAGKLPQPVRLGGAVRWLREELEAWLRAGAPSQERWRIIRSGSAR